HVPVDAHGQYADIDHNPKFTALELITEFSSFVCRRVAVDIAGLNSGGLELLLDMLRMKPVDGKAKGWAANAVLEPSLHDVGDQRVAIDGLDKLIDLIVARYRAYPLQIRMRRRKDFERR